MRLPARINLAYAIPIAIVLVVYVFFGSDGTFQFRRLTGRAEYDRERGRFGRGYYPSLSEGFLHGQLSMYEKVSPELAALADPWTPEERGKVDAWALWDTSYLNGRYYMYWTALPVFFFYIPFRFLARGYPPEGLAAVFFATWAFLAAVMFVRRALADRKPVVPMPVWLLLLGIGNFIPFVLVFARTYEVANLTGVAMGATWAMALLRFVQAPSRRQALWVGLWLGLAIAARPNLGVLIVPTAFAVWRQAFGGTAPHAERRTPNLLAAAIPLAIISTLLLWYNYARFHNPFEFGTKYQITVLSMQNQKVCSLCTPKEFARFVNNTVQYLAAPVGFWSQFPFAVAYPAQLDPATIFPAPSEQTAGVGPMIPLTIIGSLAALVFAAMRERAEASTRAAMLVMLGAWLVMFGLAACWTIVARYTLDFALLMTMASVVCIETALDRLGRPVVLTVAVILLACWSMFFGIALGFEGKEGAFRKQNPKVYQWFSKPFGTPR